MKKIAIVGVGRVGLPFALFMESLGFDVVGIDRDERMLDQLRERVMPFAEPGCAALLKQSRAQFTSDMSKVADVDALVITVGTPLMSHIETDLSNIEGVLRSIVSHLRKGQCVILRSTVAPKTTEYIKKFIEGNGSLRVGVDIGLAFCPERLAEHKALEELQKLPQIIGAADKLSFELAHRVFDRFRVKLFDTTYISAELVKLFNNSARYVEFATANQFAVIANDLGQNIYEILKLANEDYPRGRICSPGLTAGTCLRKDFGMINELSPGADLLLAAWKVNEYMPFHLTELAAKHASITGANVSVLGYTFKGNSDDTRDSLAPKLIRYLERHIPKSIKICEPHIKETKIGKYENVDLGACLPESDIVFVAVNHDQFREKGSILNLLKRGAVVIDVWNCLQTNNIVYMRDWEKA